jgi:hypothetical protein
MTEPTPEQVQERMERLGLTEKEARVSVHLEQAQRLLFELMDEENSGESGTAKFAGLILRETHIREHFRSLNRELAVRVLRRDYPEGWGYMPPRDDDQE